MGGTTQGTLEESTLLAYLYQSPVRIVITDLQGEVEMMTPVAAQMLMPLCRNGRLDNLFEIFATSVPQLPTMVHAATGSIICDGLQVPVQDRRGVRHIALSLHRVAANTLSATLADVTDVVQRQERERAAVDLALQERDAQVQRMARDMNTVLDVMPAMMACWSADLQLRFANLAFARWMGKSVEQLVGQPMQALLHTALGPGVVDTLQAPIAAVLRGEPQTCEHAPLTWADGEIRVLASHLLPDLQDARVQGFYQLVHDITASKKSQLTMEASEALMRRTGRLAQVGGWTLDLRSQACAWSPQLYEIYEVPADFSPSPDTTLQFYQPQDRASVSQAVQQAATRGAGWDMELQIRTARGAVKWVRSVGEVDQVEGTPVRVVGALHDITERKAIEAELLAHRNHLEDLVTERTAQLQRAEFLNEQALELAQAGHWSVDLAQAPDCFVISERAAEIYGLHSKSGQYLLQTDWLDRVAAVDAQAARQALENYRRAAEGRSHRHDVTHPFLRPVDGRLIWVHSLGRVSNDPLDGRKQMHGVVMDVTESREAQDQLRRARDAADVASRAKSEFLANMSHEIRTPLNAISGMARLIRQGDLSAEQRERIEKLELAKDHLLRTINNVLDLSKIEAGKFDLEDSSVHVDHVIDSVMHMLADRAHAKGLLLQAHPPAIGWSLRGDQTRLVQALLNFASNAVKFTERGSVTLCAEVVHETAQTLTVRFEVRDTGIGIDAPSVGRLFSAFEQVDSSTTRKYGGTGLGLAITRKIAEMMGGTAGVRSVLGQGSEFWFTACLRKSGPLLEQTAQRSDEEVMALLRTRYPGRRVLLAEDDEMNQEIAQILMEEISQTTEVAHNGAQALACAQNSHYDLVLMDMQMPVMDGLEATRQIRQLPGWKNVPIIALTGNAFAEDRARCLDAGMNDFLTKPIDPADLYRTMLRWLARE